MFYLGIDFGTSGARAVVLNEAAIAVHEQAIAFPAQSSDCALLPKLWRSTLFQLLADIPPNIQSALKALAINGTSSTVMLCDRQGEPVVAPMMYNDPCPASVLEDLKAYVPTGHPVLSRTSSLAKLMSGCAPQSAQGKSSNSGAHDEPHHEARYLMHQADWLAAQLHGQMGISDYHNSLKLGYDPELEAFPDWFEHGYFDGIRSLLPEVVAPGQHLGTILRPVADALGLPPLLEIRAGSTDSIAAFLASGATEPGDAVTSLGSTLVLKLLSQTRVDQGAYGIYSHRLGQQWLVGGASNTGGAVLAHFFSPVELADYSKQINLQVSSGLHYYPLLTPGERFPVNDAMLQPQLAPRPESPVEFLQGLLESMARIEAEGYRKLVAEGATPLARVLTAGGGAQNDTWTQIRGRVLGVSVGRSPHTEAAFGTARLAMGCLNSELS